MNVLMASYAKPSYPFPFWIVLAGPFINFEFDHMQANLGKRGWVGFGTDRANERAKQARERVSRVNVVTASDAKPSRPFLC